MNWQDIFINAEQLSTLIPSDVMVFDCRFQLAVGDQAAKGQVFYDEGHIPGAHYLDLEQDLSAPIGNKTSRHPLPDKEQFNALAERFNLTPNSKIICYDQGSLAFAARAWFLFHHFGFHCVRILAGGWSAWQLQSDQATSAKSALPSAKKVAISPVFIPVRIIDKEAAISGKYQLIDAREATRFRGESEPIDPIAGAIPQARNAVWLDCFDESRTIKPAEWHIHRWQGYSSERPLAHYCGSGVTALVNIISALLAEQGTQYFYPGGWSEYLHFAATNQGNRS